MKGNLYIFTAIIIAGLIIGGAVLLRQSPEEKIPSSPAPLIAPENESGYPVLGNPGAGVAMTVFSDFQCHFCKTFSQTIEPAIIEKYVKTGKIKIVFRDFAFLGEESNWAAEAAHCADEQGKYFDYVEKLHSVQKGHDASAFNRELLKNFGRDLGLDTSRFNECFDSRRYSQAVKDSFEEGVKMGVKGTPTVFVNNQIIDGVQPLNVYEEAIERELK